MNISCHYLQLALFNRMNILTPVSFIFQASLYLMRSINLSMGRDSNPACVQALTLNFRRLFLIFNTM